ncbi:OsmC family protein [Bacillus sp. FJAT-22090]|uniref:OsmC family protein n=1 Tax=Bacillus sp. FJAT-22090 TaxID=1581038 RepID=UPI00119D7F1A|nr:OsmC family protein [Bacillus sp. FJAT-22090]
MEVKAIWQGGRAFEAKGPSGYPMSMDATPNYGGEGQAPTPTEMLLSSLAGCIGIDVTMILKPHLDNIESIEITVVGSRREELPTAFTAADLLFDVKGNIDAKKVIRAIKLGEEKYCAVSASLKADISYRLILNGEEIEIQE